MAKTTSNTLKLQDTTRIVAHIHGVTPRYVQMVRKGDRDDETVTESVITFEQGVSNLIKEIKRIVPITTNPGKYARQKN